MDLRRFATSCVCTLLLSLSAVVRSQAQDYPTRPVRIVVPAAPGGSFDALARILAQGLSERWPQRVIVDNRPGGGGNIGAGVVAKAQPDGYTLLTWNDSLLINPWLFKEVPLDPKRDFIPISLSMYSPNVLAAHPSASIKTFAEFVAAARAAPGGAPGLGRARTRRATAGDRATSSSTAGIHLARAGRRSRPRRARSS